MNFFSQDNKVVQILSRIGDLMILNFFALVYSIPVITCGASLSALYAVTLKMVRDEEGEIGKSFIKAFKGNFKQSTLIWIIGMGINLFLYVDIRILSGWNGTLSFGYKMLLLVFLVFVSMCTMFSLVVQARFENTLINTIRNASFICILHIIKSAAIFVIMLAPIWICTFFPRAFIFMILLGMSGTAYLNSIFFRRIFENYE